jgi:hypothetical protein
MTAFTTRANVLEDGVIFFVCATARRSQLKSANAR